MLNKSMKARAVRWAAALVIVTAIGAEALAQNRFAVTHFNWDGSLNSTFGAAGLVTTDFPPAWGAAAQAMAVDSLGRIIVVGADSDGQFALACYDQHNGELDASFGIGGRVVTSFGAGLIAQTRAVAIASNGDIVVAGEVFLEILPASQFAIARYNAQGSLLWSVTTDFPGATSSGAMAVAIDGQGRIVAAGYSKTLGYAIDGRIALARYDANGNLDPAFDGDGNADGLITTNLYYNLDSWYYNREQANGIAFFGSHLLVAGHHVQGYEPSSFFSEFLVLRYRSDGSLYPYFGQDGVAVPFADEVSSLDKIFRANAIGVDSNGKILAAGRASTNGGGPYFALARLNSNGTPDTTFSGDGKVVTGFGWAPGEATAMAVRGTSVMLAGWSGTQPAFRSFVLSRYNSSGSLDTSFDGDGRAGIDVACQASEAATGIAIYPPGGHWQTTPRIFVAGYAAGDPCRAPGR